MNHGKRKMYRGSVLIKQPKTIVEVFGMILVAMMVTGLIMIGLAM